MSKRKIFPFLLTLSLLLFLLPTMAQAASESSVASSFDVPYAVDGGVIYFDASAGAITGFSFTGSTSVNIPPSINGVPVTAINAHAFKQALSITSVTIPGSVKTIGEQAFYGCKNLQKLVIEDGVTSIDDMAFGYCYNLTDVTLPESVTDLHGLAFYLTAWQKALPQTPEGFVIVNDILLEYRGDAAAVTVPNGITRIADSAFTHTSGLTSVTIPESVTAIGGAAFFSCPDLAEVSIPASVTEIGGRAFYGTPYLAALGDLPVVNGILLTYQGESARVNVPQGVTAIADRAFWYNETATGVTLPAGVTYIGEEAFSFCFGLKSINIPAGVTHIGENAFSGTAIEAISLPEGVTYIGDEAFSVCDGLTSVTIPESVKTIGVGAFRDCGNLKTITLPSGLTVIPDGVFASCKSLTGVTIPDGVTEIGDRAFEDCESLASVTIPDGVTEIGDRAFGDCASLTSVTIPDGVKYIGDRTFYNCESLASATIPVSVTSIGRGCFDRSPLFETVFYGGTEKQWQAISIHEVNTGLANATVICSGQEPVVSAPFTDVSPESYYAASVAWAVAQEITNGTTETTFSPDRTCTRAHILTFLWRAAGEPVVAEENTFTDVKETDYFHGAALWAKSLGLVTGSAFSPYTPCTRADTVYYMYVAAGEPEVKADTAFADVSADAYYAEAVAWAVAQEITNGVTETTFVPGRTCTRAQIVTFLYRAEH